MHPHHAAHDEAINCVQNHAREPRDLCAATVPQSSRRQKDSNAHDHHRRRRHCSGCHPRHRPRRCAGRGQGLRQHCRYHVKAPSKSQLLSCSTVTKVANTYLSTGKASGYVVVAPKGLTGRNLYKSSASTKTGFQIYQNSTK